MIRKQDAQFIVNTVQHGNCASIIGLSNMGKSALLRALCAPSMQVELLDAEESSRWLYVYVDCNLMPERSEQALHEITLRSIIAALRRTDAHDSLLASLDELYLRVVQPVTPIRGPLAFNSAVQAICESSGHVLVLLFDEFDDPFEKLSGRTFLNLRAMKDQAKGALTYVTATERPLAQISQDPEAAEFIELFDTRERWIGFLNRADAIALARELTADQPASEADIAFIVQQAGGHSGLLEAVTDEWRRIAAGAPADARENALELVCQVLDDRPVIRLECAKLWGQLEEGERVALIAQSKGMHADENALQTLRMKGLIPHLSQHDDGVVIGEVWRAFIHRQGLAREDLKRGVTVDVDSGEVYVDGRRIEPLTELEYKLLLLLYGRLNKIVDKYTIVTNVWGETYLDSVDDARIEKLVSRLRGKLEPNAEEPRYLVTLRGRGYKLIG